MSTCGTITSASLFAIAPFGVSVIQASCQLAQKKKKNGTKAGEGDRNEYGRFGQARTWTPISPNIY
jgi:hypothetical protein